MCRVSIRFVCSCLFSLFSIAVSKHCGKSLVIHIRRGFQGSRQIHASSWCMIKERHLSFPLYPVHSFTRFMIWILPPFFLPDSLTSTLSLATSSTTSKTFAMFKRSFTSKNRVGKAVKPAKRTYRDKAKEKMEESLDSPPAGRYVLDIHAQIRSSLNLFRTIH